MNPPKYILGFAFNRDKSKVLLIKKNRPQWQAGFFNGIGGKIEDFDASTADAMVREFREETGIVTSPEQWNQYAKVASPYFDVTCYWTVVDNFEEYQSITDEIVFPVGIDYLFNSRFESCLHNLC